MGVTSIHVMVEVVVVPVKVVTVMVVVEVEGGECGHHLHSCDG